MNNDSYRLSSSLLSPLLLQAPLLFLLSIHISEVREVGEGGQYGSW